MDHKRDFVTKLCDLEIPNSIKFSPNGNKILYSTSLTWGHMKGKFPVSTLWLATFGETNSSKKITDGTNMDHSPAWHPSKDEFAFISDREGNAIRSAIYVTPATDTTPKPVPITPIENEQAIEKFKFSPDGNTIAFISKDEKTEEDKQRDERREDVEVWGTGYRFSRLRVIDLKTKKISTLLLDQHILDFCWVPPISGQSEEPQITFVSCDSTFIEHPHFYGTKIRIVGANLKDPKVVCSLPSRADELTWGSTNLGKSEELYFWANSTLDKGFSGSALYKLDITKERPAFQRIDIIDDVTVTGVQAVDGHILVKAQHRLEDCLIWVGTGELFSCGHEIEAYDIALGFAEGQLKLAIATSDVNHPVEVYSVQGKNGARIRLSEHGKSLEGLEFGTCKRLTCPTVDDPKVEIDGIYLEPTLGSSNNFPETTSKKTFPTIVLVHGGPTTRVINSFNTLYYMMTPYLLSLGYAILLPNYRGSSGRGDEFASFAYGKVGANEDADVVALTQYAVEQGYADSERLVIGGYSHGGLTSNLCALRNGFHGHGWRFKAAISGASISDIDGMSLSSEMGNTYQVALHNGAAPWTASSDDTKGRKASAIWAFKEAMERSKKEGVQVVPPMLLLHGASDERIHVSQAWGMRRALEHYSLPFEMAIYPRQGHMFHEQSAWIDLVLRIGRWVERYIGPGEREAQL